MAAAAAAMLALLVASAAGSAASTVASSTPAEPASSELLAIPPTIGSAAAPIWAADGGEFAMARTEFQTSKPIKAAVAFVTAQLSPMCQPDPRLTHSDYGACLPRGGTSQPKLFGAYKLFINGQLAGMGPGRIVNQVQGVDAIDVTSAVRQGANALGLEGYHTSRFQHDAAGMLLLLVVTHTDGTNSTVATGSHWAASSAQHVFNPTGSSGAWGGGGNFPHEYMDMRQYPEGWSSAGFKGSWSAAKEQPPFVLPLGQKSYAAARPIGVFTRRAVSVKEVTASPSPPPPAPGPGPPHPGPLPPPTACGIMDEGHTVNIGCSKKGEKISAVLFASFGTVKGACGKHGANSFSKGSCDAATSVSVLQKQCVGKASCAIDIGTHTFGEPCHLVHKKLAWDVTCKASSDNGNSGAVAVVQPQPQAKAYLIDFGKELQGGVNITFRNAKAGQKVRVKLSEELLPSGMIKVPMRTTNDFVSASTHTLHYSAA